MSWIELAVTSTYPEFAEEVLLAQGAVSTSFTDAADDPILEPEPGATPLWRQTTARGLFAPDTDFAAVRAALRELLPDGAALRVRGAATRGQGLDQGLAAARQAAALRRG